MLPMEADFMDFDPINKLLEEISSDRSVPKNIRTAVDQAKADLNNEKDELDVRVNSAISILDEVANDPNIPIYTRTHIWNIVSMLETMSKERE